MHALTEGLTCLFCTVCVGRYRYKPWHMRGRDNNGEEDEREMAEIGKFDRQRGVRGRAQRGGGREGKCKKLIHIHVHRQKGCSVQHFQPFAMWVGDTNAKERGGGMTAFTSLKNDSTDQEFLRKKCTCKSKQPIIVCSDVSQRSDS